MGPNSNVFYIKKEGFPSMQFQFKSILYLKVFVEVQSGITKPSTLAVCTNKDLPIGL